MYNLRFTTAFFKTKIKPWPFAKPIMIEEHNELTGSTEYFVIDKWCYLGSVKTNKEAAEKTDFESEYVFDLDMYKILFRFLSKRENLKYVKQIDDKAFQQFHSPFTAL
jgi:DNA polymerase-3 subunit epsilon